jgi:excisionase family DNA binding protein
MIIFDDYDKMFNFLNENLPQDIKYRFLYSKFGVGRYTPRNYVTEKYGVPRNSYQIFFELEKNGYARRVISMENLKVTLRGEIYLLFWSMVQAAIKDNFFPQNAIEAYRLLSINEVAKILSVSRPTVYRLIKQKKLPVVEILNGLKRIQMKDIFAYIEESKKR